MCHICKKNQITNFLNFLCPLGFPYIISPIFQIKVPIQPQTKKSRRKIVNDMLALTVMLDLIRAVLEILIEEKFTKGFIYVMNVILLLVLPKS